MHYFRSRASTEDKNPKTVPETPEPSTPAVNKDQNLENISLNPNERTRRNTITHNTPNSPPEIVRIGGYLMKKGDNFKVWKRRFFIFEGDRLDYKKTPETSYLKGSIPMRHFEIDHINDETKDFNVVTPGRTYYLRAETLQSKMNWVVELRKIQKNVKNLAHNIESIDVTSSEQASVHCANCKSSFGLTKRKFLCKKCGYNYCNKIQCYDHANRCCAGCSNFSLNPPLSLTHHNDINMLLSPDNYLANLSIRIVEGRDLRPMDRNLVADPVAMIYVGDKRCKTKAQRQTLEPYWDEQFEIPLDHAEEGGVQIAIFDEDKLSNNKFMGMIHIPLASIQPDILYDNWFALQERPSEGDDMIKHDDSLNPNSGVSVMKGTGLGVGFSNANNFGSNAGSDIGGNFFTRDIAVRHGDQPHTATPASPQNDSSKFNKLLNSLTINKLPFLHTRGSGPVKGMIRVQLAYTYSPLALHDLAMIEETTKAALSKRLFSLNTRRAKRLIKGMGFSAWRDWYKNLLAWRNPLHTIIGLVVYQLFVLCYPSEYVCIIPPLLLLLVMFGTYVDRIYNDSDYAPLSDFQASVGLNGGVVGGVQGGLMGGDIRNVYEAWYYLRQGDSNDDDEDKEGSETTTVSTANTSTANASASTHVEDHGQSQGQDDDEEEGQGYTTDDNTDDSRSMSQSQDYSSHLHSPLLPHLPHSPHSPSYSHSVSVSQHNEQDDHGHGLTDILMNDIHEDEEEDEDGDESDHSTQHHPLLTTNTNTNANTNANTNTYVNANTHTKITTNAGSDDEASSTEDEDYIPSEQQLRQRQQKLAEARANAAAQSNVDNTTSRDQKLTLLAQARRYHHILTTVQNVIGDICALMEKGETIVTWRDPRRASIVTYILIAVILVLIVVPLRVCLSVLGFYVFTSYFKSKKGLKKKRVNLPKRFLTTTPSLLSASLNNQSINPNLAQNK